MRTLRNLAFPFGPAASVNRLGSPLDFGANLGQQLATFGRLRNMFGVPTDYIRHAGAFADVVTLAANTTAVIVPSTGSHVQQRYRVSLRVVDPLGTAAQIARGARFTITATLENEQIVRTVFVSAGGAASLFVEGRTIGVTGQNFSGGALQVNVSIDEADETASGSNTWLDVQLMEQIIVETALTIPPFCVGFVILSPTGTPAPTLTGFGQSPDGVGATDYTEVIAVPRSTTIPYSPGLAYTLTPAGVMLPRNHVVQYTCEG